MPRLNYFARNTTTFSYNTQKASPFTFVDLSYRLGNGFGAVYETQFIDQGDRTLIQPRFGLEYSKSIGKNLALYAINSINLPTDHDPLLYGELVATLRWTPPFRKEGKINAVVQVETVTDYGERGLFSAGQKVRLGIGNKRFETGLGIDFSQTSSSSSQTIGGFLGLNF